MRAISLDHAIAILSTLPPATMVVSWEASTFDVYTGQILLRRTKDTFQTAKECVKLMKLMPGTLANGKDIGDFPVYFRGHDIRVTSPMLASDFRSQDNDLVVREFDGGKYTAIYYRGTFAALRYGTPWRDLTGDKFVSTLFLEFIGNCHI